MVNITRSRSKYHAILTVVNMIKYQREIPVHKAGQVFSSLQDLLSTPWIKVRKILKYEAGAVYER